MSPNSFDIPDSRFTLTYPGWIIAGAILVLTLLGIASIYVTDTHYVAGHDGAANAMKQAVRVIVALGVAIFVVRVGYQQSGRYAYLIFAASVALLLPLLVAKLTGQSFGGLITPRNGAFRWIQLPGALVQPSEFVKLGLVVALAWYLRYRKNYRRFAGLLLPCAASLVPLALILMQPDLGTALLLAPVLFVMLFVAGARVGHLAILVIAAAAAVPFAWQHAPDYQRLRVTSLLLQSESLRRLVIENPEKYEGIGTRRQALEWSASAGYQLVHSKNAIGSGGLWGQGWGNGVYVENPLLPDRHNDFIFALIAHQWGLAGSALMLLCYAVIVAAGTRIASQTTEPFARLLAAGVVTLIACQVIINVGMAVGLLPITGMTLPFVSYGGSSLLVSFVAAALLVSISQHRPYLLTRDPFVFKREHHEDLHETRPRMAPAPLHVAV